MELKRCGIHKNKSLECFCWTCQTTICQFCMQGHSIRSHKVYNLRAFSVHCEKQIKAKANMKEVKVEEDKSTKQAIKPNIAEEIKVVKQVPNASEGVLCIKCEQAINSSKDVALKCQHWGHRECLKE